MAELDKGGTVTMQEHLVSALAQTDALVKLLIEKGLITKAEFMRSYRLRGRGIRRCWGR